MDELKVKQLVELKELLEDTIEYYCDENTFDVNSRDKRDRTILHKSAFIGDEGVIRGLL